MEDFKKPSSPEPNINSEPRDNPFKPKSAPIGPKANPFKPKPTPIKPQGAPVEPVKPIEPTSPVSVNTPVKPHKSTGLAVGLICCAIAAAIGLGLGIFNLLQNNSLSSSLDTQKSALNAAQQEINELKTSVAKLVEETSGTDTVEFKCTPPTSVDDIWSINVQNGPNAEYFIDPSSNEIRYISYTKNGNEESSTDKTVIVDTSDVIQHVYDNTNGSLADDDFSGEDYSWYVSIDGEGNSSCMVAGQDTPPAWFNTLVTMLESKKGN